MSDLNAVLSGQVCLEDANIPSSVKSLTHVISSLCLDRIDFK